MPGSFIVLEGLDGSGTTTQCAELARCLRARGHEVVTTGQPSDGRIGRMIRMALSLSDPPPRDALALLFAADRLAHVRDEIAPALERGAVVLCDRYRVSSLAYQGLDCPRDWILSINERAPSPDLTFLVRVTASVARARVQGRIAEGGTEEMFDHDDLQERLFRAYDELSQDPRLGVTVVDGEVPVESVTADLLARCLAAGL